MKFTRDPEGTCCDRIELTRRNLETLLAKLDDPLSACTLGKAGEDGGYALVKAVEDAEHYTDRPPGDVYMPSSRELR